ncbi:NAD-binding protein [Fomitiporia mediterranea MF3/22]|uniref:NAD-binding protein n=1 Tax=Fomitiporia mediterranea (strain MF3/22) TaxID=694068 RepID=UPI0004408D8F|nr:NAD-binding protein [Fomitiporia mediterranea MF3/22]EJD02776.1 NAD-binding protein [Fomitiporia mediterranea MF3/22]
MSSSSIPTSARAVVLQNYVPESHELDLSSSPSGTFTVKEIPIPSPLPEDSLLVQTVYLSNDPYPRLFVEKSFKFEREDMVPLSLGTPYPLLGLIGRVVQVGGNDENGPHKVGDYVEVFQSYWADYVIVRKDKARARKEVPGVSISTYLGALGISGASAYWVLHGVLKPKETDTLVVSAAAGSVGNVAVQFAKKVMGVKRVVGIAGSDEKCKWVKSIGADEAVNYKSPTFAEDLKKATPDKVDSYFDNVGGPVLDEVMMRMKPHGVICAIGLMALQKDPQAPVVMRNYSQILVNRLLLKGFTLMDYFDRLGEAEEALTLAVSSGKVVLDGAETVVDIHGNVEEIPRVWNGLFTGANTGKLITKVSD